MKLLVISRDCFSDTNANGKTLKALLNAFSSAELAQFYTGTDYPDYKFCNSYFRITDMQMLMSFIKTPGVTISQDCVEERHYRKSRIIKMWDFIKRLNYNYAFRYLREILWGISPKWRCKFENWLRNEHPNAILYMVGDSFYLDNMVERIAEKFSIPIILFNVEAYRIIDCKKRCGFDKIYNLKSEFSYKKLQSMSSLTVYNCDTIADSYKNFYGINREVSVVAYNAHTFDVDVYESVDNRCNIVYFGNLGVGRIGSILDVADALIKINSSLKIDVYGVAPENEVHRLLAHPQISYHGLVDQQILLSVKQSADILLQVESFHQEIMDKLKFAFSTKIAQCLCAGRAILSYAPLNTASTIYLQSEDAAVIAVDKISLYKKLHLLINDVSYRTMYAQKALMVGHKNHDAILTGKKIKSLINNLI